MNEKLSHTVLKPKKKKNTTRIDTLRIYIGLSFLRHFIHKKRKKENKNELANFVFRIFNIKCIESAWVPQHYITSLSTYTFTSYHNKGIHIPQKKNHYFIFLIRINCV